MGPLVSLPYLIGLLRGQNVRTPFFLVGIELLSLELIAQIYSGIEAKDAIPSNALHLQNLKNK